MLKEYTKLDKLLIFIMMISIFYIFISIHYYGILVNLISILFIYPTSILSITFILTLSYQTLSQIIRTPSRRSYILIYGLLTLSTGVPLVAALNTNDINIALEYVSYIVLTNTIASPLVATLSLMIPEKGYRNPLRLALIFIVIYANIAVLELAVNLQLNETGNLNVNKLGIYEVKILIVFYQAFASIFSQSQISPQVSDKIANISLTPIDYIIPIIIIISFIYCIKSIKNNYEYYTNNLNKEKNILIIENKYLIINNLALVSILSVLLLSVILITINELYLNVDPSYALSISVIPFVMLLIILILNRK